MAARSWVGASLHPLGCRQLPLSQMAWISRYQGGIGNEVAGARLPLSQNLGVGKQKLILFALISSPLHTFSCKAFCQVYDLESSPVPDFVSGVSSRYELGSRSAKVRYVYICVGGGGVWGRLIPGIPLFLTLPECLQLYLVLIIRKSQLKLNNWLTNVF